ncbi:MAG: Mur ligase family protein [bacterium]|nr:Mur ligase family protein [bacterium]
MKKIYVFLRDVFYHRIMAFCAAAFYGFPSRRLTVIGVTGTKGKSTTVELIAHILESAGKKVAVSSSVRNTVSGMTMPGCFKLQQLLRAAVSRGCEYAVIEVTSQGVVQSRHRFINWAVVVFANLAPEHIEAHGGFEKYRAAKVAFFEYAAKNSQAVFVINKDDENALYFVKAARHYKKILFGGEEAPATLHGVFNEYNVGAALAVASALGIFEDVAKRAIADFKGVYGRMEFLQRMPFTVVVDYAVTPDSLRAAYHAFAGSRIISVFGCTGGGRDTWKRRVMGGIAGEACALVVLTDDDSYDEDTEAIMAEIEAGLVSSKDGWRMDENYWKIADRRKAIEKALSMAQPEDVVLVTGKGGDKWLRMKRGVKIPWSDQDTIRDILKAL